MDFRARNRPRVLIVLGLLALLGAWPVWAASDSCPDCVDFGRVGSPCTGDCDTAPKAVVARSVLLLEPEIFQESGALQTRDVIAPGSTKAMIQAATVFGSCLCALWQTGRRICLQCPRKKGEPPSGTD